MEKKILTILLPERIDTATSSEVNEMIKDSCSNNPHETVVLDASQLTYISSSGLRIILSLSKREKDVKMTEVCQEVYDVLSMTGFTRILNVEKRLREVSIEGCKVIGVGGVGTVYQLTEETIIKVFREGSPLEDVQKEISISKEAFVLGMPTAISFEIVRVDEQYGLIFELINAQTLASVINEDTSKAEHYGTLLGRLLRDIHSIKDTQGVLPDDTEETMQKMERLRVYFTDEQIALLREIYDAIPQGNSVMHCDLHPKNVMVSNGELILIDMGEVCHGNPLKDISHTYSSMRGLIGDYQAIIGLDEEVSHRCFDAALRAYFDTDDEALIARRAEQIRVASLIRNFSWLSLSDSFPKELIESCQHAFKERITDNMTHIREILPQFSEWRVI